MLALVLAALVSPAAPGEPPQLVVAQTKKEMKKRPPPKPPPPAPPSDFDLLPPEAAPDPAAVARQKELEQKLELRRTMLQLHQAGGIIMLASLTTTVVLGQLDYLDKYGGRGDTGKYHLWHRWFGFGTATIFAGTASLAVFAPVPLPKETRLDTATVHKLAMTVATAGMLAEVVLGIVTAAKEGQLVQRDFALAHQIIGYTTLAASFTGFGVLTF